MNEPNFRQGQDYQTSAPYVGDEDDDECTVPKGHSEEDVEARMALAAQRSRSWHIQFLLFFAHILKWIGPRRFWGRVEARLLGT